MPWILGQLVDLSEQDERRSASRGKLRLDINVEGVPNGLVKVLDLSCTGMMIHSEFPIAPGESLIVQLPDGKDTVAQVIWRRQTLIGCRFLPPLSQAAMASIMLKAAPPPPPRKSA